MKKLLLVLMIVMLRFPAHSAVIFEDTFDGQSDWTVTQPSGSTESCYPGTCSIILPTGWDAFYNGACLCDDGFTGEPGNNLMYVDQYAGYPDAAEAPYGGSGKCVTFWQESCITHFDNSDGQLAKYLGQEYYEFYSSFQIKFKAGFERQPLVGQDGFAMKIFHYQHHTEPNQPFSYGGNDSNDWNKPVVIGGINQYSTNINFYAQIRCVDDYMYCGTGEQTVLWNLGAVPDIYTSGMFDNDWHQVVLHVVVNTVVDDPSGSITLYLDGVEVNYINGYEGTNLLWNDSAVYGARGIDVVGFGGNSYNYWESSSTDMADREQWYAVDNFGIYTTLEEALAGPSGTTYADPTAAITDPANGFSTTASTITVSGTTTKDIALTITGVSVNGVAATSSDGFATWSATVSISVGPVTLTATVTDSEGQIGMGSVTGTRTEIPAGVQTIGYSGTTRVVDYNGTAIQVTD